MTFSGGEPFMQPVFLAEVLSRCRKECLHTAVDTSGYAPWQVIRPLLADVDLFLYDLKLMDDAEHRRFTGVSNLSVLENLQKIAHAEKAVQVRIPLIPGITDSDKNIFSIAEFLEKMPALRQVSLLNFHKGGEQKYRRKGLTYTPGGAEPLTEEAVGRIKAFFEQRGFCVSVGE